jgi:hypothetical protein
VKSRFQLLACAAICLAAAPAPPERAFALPGEKELSSPAAAAVSLQPAWEARGEKAPSSDASSQAPTRKRRVFDLKTTAAVVGGSLVTPFIGNWVWWSGNRASFHVFHEGFFGRDTYAGGADKASHFYFSYVGTELLTDVFRKLGHPDGESRLLALGTGAASGLLVELGDGFSNFGFSPEDFAADMTGVLVSVGVSAARAEDLLGARIGLRPAQEAREAVHLPGAGLDYSPERFTLDLKLGGAARRLTGRTGPARFVLLSLTYNTQSYGFVPTQLRQRNVGVQIGVNLYEVAEAAGVPASTWWGKPLLFFLRYFEVPYSALGFAYDLNHGRWHGPIPWHRYTS